MITLSCSSINFCPCNSDRVWFRSQALDLVFFLHADETYYMLEKLVIHLDFQKLFGALDPVY
jgi:hypothetical protein